MPDPQNAPCTTRLILVALSLAVAAFEPGWTTTPLATSDPGGKESVTKNAADAKNVPARRDYAEVARVLETFIENQVNDKKLPAFSIALVDDQQIVWAQGFGYAEPDQKRAATAETVYRVGSVSKLFTDIGIMQLVERGQLDLDAPITKYLPEFHPRNPFGQPITLRELMTHRAGLVREPPVGSYFDTSQPALAAVVKSLNTTELVYAPGTHTKYSNAGVTVAGYVLEQLKQQPYTKYLKESVVTPLGLKESCFEPDAYITQNLAKSYMWTYDGRVFVAPTFQLGTGPAGNMYSTVTDMGRFLSVLFAGGRGPNGPVLKPETLQQMWTPQFSKPGEKTGFGLGFVVGDFDGHRTIGHRGGVYGFATQLLGLPADKLGVVTITTMDSSSEVTWHVANVALRQMLAARARKPLPPVPVTTSIPAERARRLVGRYGEGTHAVDLMDHDGKLSVLPVWGGMLIELRQLGNSLVTDDRLGWGWEMVPTEGGLEFDGETHKRADTPKPAPVSERWRNLIGEYGWDHNILYIIEKDNRLTALVEWFEYAPLKEISENVFQFSGDSSYDHEKLVFTLDGNGRATDVRLEGISFPRRK